MIERVRKLFVGVIANESRMIRLREMLIFLGVYLSVFVYLENRKVPLHILHSSLDAKIPFCEYFVIPYLMWFGYIAVTLIYFAFIHENYQDYYRLSRSLFVGCSLFLLISYVFPNGQLMRPVLHGDNLFQVLVAKLYATDTSTNIFPSIHVFNSVVCQIAWNRAGGRLAKLRNGLIGILTVSIILSTVFLKQHTLLDVVGAFVLNLVVFVYFYRVQPAELQTEKAGRRRRRFLLRDI